jgi:hypothetical protein
MATYRSVGNAQGELIVGQLYRQPRITHHHSNRLEIRLQLTEPVVRSLEQRILDAGRQHHDEEPTTRNQQPRQTRQGQPPDSGSRQGQPALVSAAAGQALRSDAMHLMTVQAGLLAAELEARGFLAGIGKTILVLIIILVAIGGLIGFSVARRFGQRR